MLDRDFARDDQSVRRRREGRDRDGVAELIAVPTDLRRRPDVELRGLDANIVSFARPKHEPMGSQGYRRRVAIFGEVDNRQALHRSNLTKGRLADNSGIA